MLNKMLKIMVAVHQKHKNMQYFQGINFIVGSLSIHCDEHVVFELFDYLLLDMNLIHYYCNIEDLIQKTSSVTQQIFNKSKDLTEKIGKSQVFIMNFLFIVDGAKC